MPDAGLLRIRLQAPPQGAIAQPAFTQLQHGLAEFGFPARLRAVCVLQVQGLLVAHRTGPCQELIGRHVGIRAQAHRQPAAGQRKQGQQHG